MPSAPLDTSAAPTLIAAMVTLVAMVILVVTLAVLGNPSWWIFLVAGLVVFFSLLDPHPGSGSGG